MGRRFTCFESTWTLDQSRDVYVLDGVTPVHGLLGVLLGDFLASPRALAHLVFGELGSWHRAVGNHCLQVWDHNGTHSIKHDQRLAATSREASNLHKSTFNPTRPSKEGKPTGAFLTAGPSPFVSFQEICYVRSVAIQ